jgi:hypothetical protein
MRASARTRPTFLSRKVGKSIRSDAQPFGFPRVLGQTGETVNSLRSDIRPLVSCLPCAARLRESRRWRSFQSFRRSPNRGRILRRAGSAPTDEFERCVIVYLLTRRASQSLTGNKRGVFKPAKLASWRAPGRGQKRRAAAGRVSRVPFSLPSFFWASKRKKGAAAHPPHLN